MKKAAVGLVVTGLVAVLAVSACSDDFQSCTADRTCPTDVVAGAGAGGADGESGAGGQSSPDGGKNGGGSVNVAGAVGVSGDAGAGGGGPECLFVSCECEENDTQPCGPEEEVGICKKGTQTCTQGGWGECVGAVEPLPRDCTSADDNDCDGSPDNTIDDACKCVPGTKEACGEHPGQDGKGPCQAGERTCMGSGNMGVWGACEGSVGPKASDRCDEVGNDDNCDDQENGGCTCLSGDKSNCLDVYASKGICSTISLTCTALGKWPSSTNCAATKTEACVGDGKDENCDGVVNEGCECVNGVPKVCGDCNEGTQPCTNGKYGACTATGALTLEGGPRLLCVKGATFMMGADNGNTYEGPPHLVPVDTFWMDESEVTVAQYTACNQAGDCGDLVTSGSCLFEDVGKDNYPINCVNKEEAEAFCTWAGKRLPTEEEWEYAARSTTQRTYPWGNSAPDANKAVFGQPGPAAVMTHAAGKSPFGMHDMAGNVREWTSTFPCSYPDAGPTNCPATDLVITRGGYYGDSAASITTTYRYSDDPNTNQSADFGFRCAKDL